MSEATISNLNMIELDRAVTEETKIPGLVWVGGNVAADVDHVIRGERPVNKNQ